MILPNFLIIGAMRSGTTSLYHYLRQHPDIFMPEQKELNYFSYCAPTSLSMIDYSKHFENHSKQNAIGEASPLYLYYPHVIPLIAEKLPKVKIIVILRQPVDRAYSHYLYSLKLGREWLSFEEAVSIEETRIEKYKKKYSSRPSWFYCYKDMSRYGVQIARVLEHFPKDQLLVLTLDQLTQDPAGELGKVCRFVGVGDDYFFRKISRLDEQTNATQVPNDVVKMKYLAYFRENFRNFRFFWRINQVAEKLQKRIPLVQGQVPQVNSNVRKQIYLDLFKNTQSLSRLLDRDFSAWEEDPQ